MAYCAYQQKMADFAQAIKQRVKAVSSLREIKEGLGLTANMYYQRLNYPQNISSEEAANFAKLLEDATILQYYNEAQELGHILSATLTNYLKEAKISVRFVCEKLQVDTSNFYRKQKDPRLWNKKEIDKITQVVETMKSL